MRRRRTRASRSLVIAAVAVFALAVAVIGAIAYVNSGTPKDHSQVTLTIRRGSSFREAAESLAAHRVVANARLFSYYATWLKRDRTMRYGTYLFRSGATSSLRWSRARGS
jgi:cell division protein YceG involved in septum cleavage